MVAALSSLMYALLNTSDFANLPECDPYSISVEKKIAIICSDLPRVEETTS